MTDSPYVAAMRKISTNTPHYRINLSARSVVEVLAEFDAIRTANAETRAKLSELEVIAKALEEENASLRAALLPFALAGHAYTDVWSDHDDIGGCDRITGITVGDLRRAIAAIERE